jgi:hypothetical protein
MEAGNPGIFVFGKNIRVLVRDIRRRRESQPPSRVAKIQGARKSFPKEAGNAAFFACSENSGCSWELSEGDCKRGSLGMEQNFRALLGASGTQKRAP